MNNYENIKNMDVKSFAEYFGKKTLCVYLQDFTNWCVNRNSCNGCIEEWLKSEVDNNELL